MGNSGDKTQALNAQEEQIQNEKREDLVVMSFQKNEPRMANDEGHQDVQIQSRMAIARHGQSNATNTQIYASPVQSKNKEGEYYQTSMKYQNGTSLYRVKNGAEDESSYAGQKEAGNQFRDQQSLPSSMYLNPANKQSSQGLPNHRPKNSSPDFHHMTHGDRYNDKSPSTSKFGKIEKDFM